MGPVTNVIKVTVPDYLTGLPIPDTFGGWFKLGVRDWLSFIPFTAVIAGVTYISYKAFCPKARGAPVKPKINSTIQKNESKVVHVFDVEDLGDNAAFCRCWQSKKFPYCDGSHNAHNEQTGDNLGPLCVGRKKK